MTMIAKSEKRSNSQNCLASLKTSSKSRQRSASRVARNLSSTAKTRIGARSGPLLARVQLVKRTKSQALQNTPNLCRVNTRETFVEGRRTIGSPLLSANTKSEDNIQEGDNQLDSQPEEERTQAHVETKKESINADKGNAKTRQLAPRADSADQNQGATLQWNCATCKSAPTIQCGTDNECLSGHVMKDVVSPTSSKIDLATPWFYYRNVIGQKLAECCQMCDKHSEHTTPKMQTHCPSIFRHLTLFDFDPSDQDPLEKTITCFLSELEQLLPSSNQECLFYAYVLILEAFKRGVGIFIHSSTIKRILAIAYGFAFKYLEEIDWESLNGPLAKLLGMSVKQFNMMESEVFAALNYDIGITEDIFKTRLGTVSQECAAKYTAQQQAQQLKSLKVTHQLNNSASASTVLEKPSESSQSPKNSLESPMQQCEEPVDNASEETKHCSIESRQQSLEQPTRKVLGVQHPSGFDVCSSPESMGNTTSSTPETQTEAAVTVSNTAVSSE